MATIFWIEGSMGSLPSGVLLAGRDKNGDEIFAGRAWHEGDLLPAKVVPNKGGAYVARDGEEHHKDQYEVMSVSEASVMWESTNDDKIPAGAVVVGQTKYGERLYMGRVMHDGALTPGKVCSSHGFCYIPYDGNELPFSKYAILLLK